MHINCEKLVETYLLNQNPLYTFNFPIALIISIIVFGISVHYKWSNNSYILQILIPISVLLLSIMLLDMIAKMMLNKIEKDRLIKLCKLWMHNPLVKSNPLLNKIQHSDLDLISLYNGNIESFSNMGNAQFDNTLHVNPLAPKDIVLEDDDEIDNNILAMNETSQLNPQDIKCKPEAGRCIGGESNCHSLCSGSDKNPYNLIAPIPGPQWLPQTAEAVQNRLKNNDYTKNKCSSM
jgi:hypothetical protein